MEVTSSSELAPANSELADAWQKKARALDSYRWSQLLANGSVLASGASWAKAWAADMLLGLRAHFHTRSAPGPSQERLVLLQDTPTVTESFIRTLRDMGLDPVATQRLPLKAAIQERKLCRPAHRVPLRYYAYAAHAEWLARANTPKAILSIGDAGLITPFLRLSLNAQGKKLIQLAPLPTTKNSRRWSMTDCDLLLCPGQSALAASRTRPLRMGSTLAVLAGSPLVERGFDLPAPAPGLARLLLVGSGPEFEQQPGHRLAYELVLKWAQAHPETEICYKAHPQGSSDFWLKAAKALSNVVVLPAGTELVDVMAQASAVITVSAHGALEATLAQRPVVFVDTGQTIDRLEQGRFFGRKIGSGIDLEQRLEWLCNHHEQALQQSKAFLEHHLAHGLKGPEHLARLVDRVVRGQQIEAVSLEGTSG